jgi:hypothetical protein
MFKTTRQRIGSDGKSLTWTDPHKLVDRKARVFLYFVRVTDDEGHEYRYIGQTKGGKSRLKDYARNIDRIFAGLPRRITPGQEDYRAVHLALAKACRHDWMYELYPLEEVEPNRLNEMEQQRIRELQCNLNGAPKWRVDQFHTLTVRELIGQPAQISRRSVRRAD